VPKKIRKHPDIASKMPPPLPPVQSDSALAIFQHSSVKSSVQNERFGDAERLAFLGEKVLHMVIAEIQFEKKPMLTAVDLFVRAVYLSMHTAFISSVPFATEPISHDFIGRGL